MRDVLLDLLAWWQAGEAVGMGTRRWHLALASGNRELPCWP